MLRAKAIFLEKFSDFLSFTESGIKYASEEDQYKREASKRMQSYFDHWGHGDKTRMTANEVYGALISILSEELPKTRRIPNLTNWRDLQSIKELLKTPQSKEEFFNLAYDLLQAGNLDDFPYQELNNLISWLTTNGAPPRYTKIIPSLLLFYWKPKKFIFIKPRYFDHFLKLIGETPLKKRLDANEYLRALAIAKNVAAQISELGPRDMIDLQSFYYVVAANSTTFHSSGMETVREDLDNYIDSYKYLDETQREQIVLSRLGQGKFRESLFRFWGGCSLTGFRSHKQILTASHIKPWRESTNEERLDPFNGLLLVPNIDRLFDLGFITFSTSGAIMISVQLKEADILGLGINQAMKLLKLDRRHLSYLDFHRKNIYLDRVQR